MFFLDFSVEFICEHDCAEAKRICKEIIADQSFDIKSADDKNDKIIAAKKKNNILFINSFSPVVEIHFFKNDCGTRIRVNFRLMPVVKVLLCTYVIIAIFFEICLINFYLQNDLTSPVLLLLPLLLTLYALALCHFGLRMMSREIKSRLTGISKNRTGDGLREP